jgi:hypothetical protein
MNWQSLIAGDEKLLKQQLRDLRGQMVTAAQEVYDEWEQGDQGIDEEFGAGGICDAISQAIAGVIAENIDGVELADGGQEGDDHVYSIAYNEDEAYGVDIPSSTYETGGGYTWRKIEDVNFTPQDIDIFVVPHPDSV